MKNKIFSLRIVGLLFSAILIFFAGVFYFGQARRIKYFSAVETLLGQTPNDRDLASIDSPQAKALEEYLFKDNETGVREGKRTDGVIIYHKGQVIYEKYARGYDENKKHITWSVSKTIIALMFGIAHQEKRFQLDDSICKYQQFPIPEYCEIKIRDVLTWSSGLQWKEDYEKTKEPEKASVLAMLYGEGRFDMASFVKSHPIQNKPGEAWRYSSGDSILAAHILAGIYQGYDMRLVFQEKLFQPLDMSHSIWESDPAGTLSGAYYFFTTPRDLVAIGFLMKDHGFFRGVQLISQEYFDFMNTVPESFKKNRLDHKGGAIAAGHLWVNHNEGFDYPLSWPESPADTIAALGHWGQIVVAYPSLDAVAVRMGDTRDGSFQRSEFVKLVHDLLQGGVP